MLASLQPRHDPRTVPFLMARPRKPPNPARAERIRKVWERSGLKWREFAARLDVEPRTAQGWAETGRLSERNAEAIVREWGETQVFDYDWLWGREDEAAPEGPVETPLEMLTRLTLESREEMARLRREFEAFTRRVASEREDKTDAADQS